MKSRKNCEVCGENDWQCAYDGLVRHGDYFCQVKGRVLECNTCKVRRLDNALKLSDYVDGTYLEAYPTADKSIQLRDEIDLVPWHEMDKKLILDVGAGDLSLCHKAVQSGAKAIAVEPGLDKNELIESYQTIEDIPEKYHGAFDYIACFSVIEHVEDPIEFLKPLNKLLADKGILMVSTPSRDDIMLELIPDTYTKFFYRTAHKWYFDEESLDYCLSVAGLNPITTFYMQRFGMNNLIGWLRDNEPPMGATFLEGASGERMDWDWVVYAERIKRSDYLFNISRKKGKKEIN